MQVYAPVKFNDDVEFITNLKTKLLKLQKHIQDQRFEEYRFYQKYLQLKILLTIIMKQQ